MKKLSQFQGAMPFFIAVFLNAFVDLGHKITVQNTVFKLYDDHYQIVLTAILNGLILLPFILMISPAGFISDKFRKVEVMRASAWAVVGLCSGILVCYYQGWFWAAFGMTFLLAVQSAIYSPAKFGYIRELFGKNRLGEANGAVAAISIVAILAGIFVFSVLFESLFQPASSDPASVLKDIAPIGWVLLATSIVELAMMYKLPAQVPTGVTTVFPWRRMASGRLLVDDLKPLTNSRVIGQSVFGLALFWSVGQVMLAAFPAYIKAELDVTNTIIVQGMLACSGIGIAIGSFIAGRVSRDHIEVGLLPIGAAGFAIGLLVLPLWASISMSALTFLFIGVMGGLLIVPLNALIQFHSEERSLGATLAANNWAQNMAMLGFLILTVLLTSWGLSGKNLLQLIAIVAVLGFIYTVYQLPQSLTRLVLAGLLSRRYKVTVQGMKNIPSSGGVLMLGNHVSWIDWAILQIASPRPVRFVMAKSIYSLWYLKWFFDLFGCIPIAQGASSRQSLALVSEYLNKGDVVCLFPEGTISRTGHLAEFRQGYERACEHVNDDVVIVPFYLRGLWGSQFSRSSEEFRAARKTGMSRSIVVAFGEPLDNKTPADVLKRRVFDLSIVSWENHINELPTIARAWLKKTKTRLFKPAIADTLGTKLTGLAALTGAIILSRRIKSLNKGQNVGVLLPTSAGGMLFNMAVMLRGLTVVNLNYTASASAIESAIEQANIQTIFTSKRFVKKLEAKGIDLSPYGNAELFYLEDMQGGISTIEKLSTLAMAFVLPACALTPLVCRNQHTDNNAAILFSSGSEGEPKGVMLSQKNIMANVQQIADVLNMESDDVLFANLPLFHAFGLTVCQFLPMLEGIPVVAHPDPTDVAASAKAIASHNATIMFATSTFLRLYTRNNKVHPLMLSSLRIVVAGAERLQPEVREAFSLKFNKSVYEGYGATETTPVASVNLPDQINTEDWKVQPGQKVGSVGMPLPGTSCKIVDPETMEELPTGTAGMILIGGGQVMQGYLNNKEKTDSVIYCEGNIRWYITGDKGYLNKDGFLVIQDRYSRFAKIGGEMVSLSQVEQQIHECANQPELELVAVNIPDEKKGEKIMVLINQELDTSALKDALLQAGLAPLALPSKYFVVDDVPKLGSGKTDFGMAKHIVLAHFGVIAKKYV